MKKEKEEKNKSLGFLFGFKETEKNNDNSFTISFKSGISKKYPSKYSNKKDFWSEEIFEGQTTELYINPKILKQAFQLEMKDLAKNHSFEEQRFNERKWFFDYSITLEQYFALTSFSMAHLHENLYKKWENDEVLTKVLQETIGNFFKNDTRDILSIYKNYEETALKIYDYETEKTIGRTTKKNTI